MSVIPDPAKSEKARIEGNASFKKGRWAEAIGHYTNAALLNPEDPIALTNRSAAYLRLDKYEDALRDTSKALELDPVNLKALYRRSLARKGLGQLNGALDDLEQVLKLDPNNDTALSELDEIKVSLERLKDSESSKKKNKKIYSPPGATASISEINESENELPSTSPRATATLPPTTIPAPAPASTSAPVLTPVSAPVLASISASTPSPTSVSPSTPPTTSSNSFTALRQSRQVRKTFANGSSKPLENEVLTQSTIHPSSTSTPLPKATPTHTSTSTPKPTPTPSSPEPTLTPTPTPTPSPSSSQLPPPPSDPNSTSPGTGLHLLRHLSSLPPPSAWAYLQYYPARNIPSILSPLLEPDVLGQLLLALREGSNGSIEDRKRVQEIMDGLRNTPRFGMNIAMLSSDEKQAAQHAWKLSGQGNWP